MQALLFLSIYLLVIMSKGLWMTEIVEQIEIRVENELTLIKICLLSRRFLASLGMTT